ncbi:MAG: SDR family oxidoreductase [Anaerolineae bacterium]
MSTTAKRTVLITGASGGIGLELAKVFAREGHNLVLAARSEKKLQELAADLSQKHAVQVTVIAKDLAQPSAPDELYAELQSKHINVDILVNNAGFATYGYFSDIDAQQDMEMVQLNVAALTHLSKLFLPGMKARGWGRLMNVASTAAFQPGPLMAVYYATKAYVLSLSEALAAELRGTGVTVTALCPGPTESGFQQRAAIEDTKLVQNGLMDAGLVAEQGYRALMAGTTVYIPGWMNRIMALAPRFTPRDLTARIVMNIQQRVGH